MTLLLSYARQSPNERDAQRNTVVVSIGDSPGHRAALELLLLAKQCLLRRGERLQLLRTHLGIREPQRGQSPDDRGPDDDTGEPLVVGGHDVPRGVPGRGGADQLLVGLHVVVPELTLLDVVGRELPVLLRSLESLEETLPLLLPRDVEKELADDDAVPRRVSLEV